ncbi:unnamed protein product, partial [Hapterophycus canaliculatus]
VVCTSERSFRQTTILCCPTIFICKVMESKHNYEALTNELLFLEISGAARMTVTFDERSRTEDSYDFLVFWKDEAKTESWHPRIAKFSGSGGTCNFPGFGGRPPLVIESDR